MANYKILPSPNPEFKFLDNFKILPFQSPEFNILAKKPRKKPPTVVSSDSDLDDDQLGITPRTPPQSPFYRGRATTSTVPATTKKNKPPSTSTSKPTDRKDKTKHVSSNAKNAEQPQTSDRTKKKNKKARTALADLADEQDKLYAELNKTARNSKWTLFGTFCSLFTVTNYDCYLISYKTSFHTLLNISVEFRYIVRFLSVRTLVSCFT